MSWLDYLFGSAPTGMLEKLAGQRPSENVEDRRPNLPAGLTPTYVPAMPTPPVQYAATRPVTTPRNEGAIAEPFDLAKFSEGFAGDPRATAATPLEEYLRLLESGVVYDNPRPGLQGTTNLTELRTTVDPSASALFNPQTDPNVMPTRAWDFFKQILPPNVTLGEVFSGSYGRPDIFSGPSGRPTANNFTQY
jgi:hypothetical protein